MKLSLRYKIIAANLIVLILTFAIISIVVTESIKKVNLDIILQNSKHQEQTSLAYIYQSLLTGTHPIVNEDSFNTRSKNFAYRLSSESDMRVLIFSNSGQMLADSVEGKPGNFKKVELDYMLQGKHSYVIRSYNGSRYLHYTFPVLYTSADSISKVIGGVMFVYPMYKVDNNTKTVMYILLASFLGGIVVITVLSSLFTMRITKPIRLLKDSTKEIAQGNYNCRILVRSKDEVGDLAEAFNRMSHEIESKISQIHIESSKLNSVLESMGEGVVALDSRNEIIAINNKARLLINDRMEAELQKAASKVRESKSRVVIEFENNTMNLLLCATPLSTTQFEDGIVFILNDVTELRLLQDKQKQFVTNVSHELRTPITTILGYIDLLKNKGSDKNIFDTSVYYLEDASERLLRLINDLIDLSSLKKYEFEIEPKSTDLSGLIQEIAVQMSLKADKFNIKINTALPETLNILVDPIRMKQAIVNILDNAIKYSYGSEINIKMTTTGSSVCIDIEDNGCGIPDAVLSKVFEPFYRVDKARSRSHGGNGLGLSITREIIEKHQGTILIESSEGKGTKVSITLPQT